LFQWGRLDDGHQERDSSTTTILSNFDDPGHSKFICDMSRPYDWRNSQNDNLWQGVDGTNNPCPDGWRIPTIDEWETEQQSWSSNDANGAYNSPLKLTLSGSRSPDDATLEAEDNFGFYWSSTVDILATVYEIPFNRNNARVATGPRAAGLSVRCIRQ